MYTYIYSCKHNLGRKHLTLYFLRDSGNASVHEKW